MASTPDAAAPRRIGDYEVGDVLREGWGGTIRDGRYVPGGRRVTVQQLRHDLTASPEQRRRLAAAGRIAAEVRHPRLLALYDLVEEDDRLHLVAEWSDAAPLAGLTRGRHRLSPTAALRVVEDVLEGLAALHAAGVPHGHVSADTIVVDQEGRGILAEVDAAGGTAAGMDMGADVRDTARLGLDLIQRGGSSLAAARRVLEGALSPSRPADAAAVRSALAEAAGTVPERAASSEPASASGGEAAPAADVTAASPSRRGHRRRWIAGIAAVALVAVAVGAVLGIVVFGGPSGPRATTSNGQTTPLVLGNDASLSVTPASGACNTTFVFVGRGSLTGTGPLVYRWEQSDGQATADTTLTITADEAAYQLTQAWRLQGSQTVDGTMTLHIIKPADKRLQRSFHYACP